jgi:hypothetical protein
MKRIAAIVGYSALLLVPAVAAANVAAPAAAPVPDV